MRITKQKQKQSKLLIGIIFICMFILCIPTGNSITYNPTGISSYTEFSNYYQRYYGYLSSTSYSWKYASNTASNYHVRTFDENNVRVYPIDNQITYTNLYAFPAGLKSSIIQYIFDFSDLQVKSAKIENRYKFSLDGSNWNYESSHVSINSTATTITIKVEYKSERWRSSVYDSIVESTIINKTYSKKNYISVSFEYGIFPKTYDSPIDAVYDDNKAIFTGQTSIGLSDTLESTKIEEICKHPVVVTSYTASFYSMQSVSRTYTSDIPNYESAIINLPIKKMRVCYHLSTLQVFTCYSIVKATNMLGQDVEIEIPEDSDGYWIYTSFRIEYVNTEDIVIGFSEVYNFTYAGNYTSEPWERDYKMIIGISETAYFFYTLTAIAPEDLGNWVLDFGTLGEISFNVFRDITAALISGLILIFQFVMYLLIMGFQYLILAIPCMFILPFFNNIVLFYITITLFWIIWLLMLSLILVFYIILEIAMWLWEDIIYPILLWFYEELIVPMINWFNDVVFPWIRDVAIPWLIDLLLTIISGLITIILYIATIGQIEFMVLYNQIYSLLDNSIQGLVDIIMVFIDNIFEFILYIAMYMINISFLFIKGIYVKSKGLTKREEQIKSALEVYLLPIKILHSIVIKLKEAIPKSK